MDVSDRLIIDSGGGADLRVEGELDAYTAPALEAALAAAPRADAGPEVRLHLGGVGFIDSTGLRVIIRADNDLRAAGGRLVLVEPSPSVTRLLELTSLDERIHTETGGAP